MDALKTSLFHKQCFSLFLATSCTTITTHLVAYGPCVDESLIEKRVSEEKPKHGLVLVGVYRFAVAFLLLQSNSHQCEDRASRLTYYLRHICVWVKSYYKL